MRDMRVMVSGTWHLNHVVRPGQDDHAPSGSEGLLKPSAQPGDGESSVIRYQSGTFAADVTFDADGVVTDYPGLGRLA